MGFVGLNGDLMGLSGALYGFNGYPPVNVYINDHKCGKPTICGSFLRKTMAFPHLYIMACNHLESNIFSHRFPMVYPTFWKPTMFRCLIFCSGRGNKSGTGE